MKIYRFGERVRLASPDGTAPQVGYDVGGPPGLKLGDLGTIRSGYDLARQFDCRCLMSVNFDRPGFHNTIVRHNFLAPAEPEDGIPELP